MLKLSQLRRVLRMQEALGIPLDEGSCFGVTDPSRLRPEPKIYRSHIVSSPARNDDDQLLRWEGEGGAIAQ